MADQPRQGVESDGPAFSVTIFAWVECPHQRILGNKAELEAAA